MNRYTNYYSMLVFQSTPAIYNEVEFVKLTDDLETYDLDEEGKDDNSR